MLNNPQISIYDASGNRIPELDNLLVNAVNLQYETFYPGGLYGSASFMVPRNPRHNWRVKGNYRVKIHNGNNLVYEGIVDGDLPTSEGNQVDCVGYYAHLLGRIRTERRWADKRMTSNVWVVDETLTGKDKCDVDYDERIQFTPKNVAWTYSAPTYDVCQVVYSMPPGETITRVTGSYVLAESTQQWILNLARSTDGSTWTSDTSIATASGSGTFDVTLGSASRFAAIQFYPGASPQTPVEDGTIYGRVTDVTVYATLSSTDTEGTVNLDVLIRDIRAALSTYISADVTTFITTNTLSLVPFISEGDGETLAQMFQRAASFGDSSNNAWSVGFLSSQDSPDNLPVFYSEQQPALNSYDYIISYDERIVGNIRIGYDRIFNYMKVTYTDTYGRKQYRNIVSNASYQNSTSVTAWGRRDYLLNAPGALNTTTADNLALRFLKSNKDPKTYLSAPILIEESISTRGGNKIPAAEVRAGKRIRIMDWLNDVTGTGLTFLITRTVYRDGAVQVEAGLPDNLAIILAKLGQGMNASNPSAAPRTR